MAESEIPVCPRCGEPLTEKGATSRVDNKTEICSACGIREALWEMKHEGNPPLPPLSEPVVL